MTTGRLVRSSPRSTPLSKSREVRLRIRTREERFILEDVTSLADILSAHGRPIEYVTGRPETLITTIYFDTEDGTWSTGLSQTKLRVRNYQDPEQWWFELKRREGSRVDKWRRPMAPEKVLATLAGAPRWKPVLRAVQDAPLQPLFGVQCRRTAYEWAGLRVTVDRDLTFFKVRVAEPLTITERMGHLAGYVVEVKSEGDMPSWLAGTVLGHRVSGYSKSRYALAVRAGEDRPFLVAETPPTLLPAGGYESTAARSSVEAT